MVHAVELRDHRDPLRQDFRQFPDPAGRLAVAPFHPPVRPPSLAAPPIASPTLRRRSSPIQAPHAIVSSRDLFHPAETEHDHGLALLERAFTLTVTVQPIRDRMRTARVRDIDQALKQRTIDAAEAAQLKAAADAVAAAIAVDDFAPEEPTSRGAATRKTCHRKRHLDGHRSRDRKQPSKRRPALSSTAAARRSSRRAAAGAVHAGRSRRSVRPSAACSGNPSRIAFDQVILGCVNVIADEMNPARVAALRLGMGEAMMAFTVQINCGSGMQSIDTGYRYIREGLRISFWRAARNRSAMRRWCSAAAPSTGTRGCSARAISAPGLPRCWLSVRRSSSR